MNSVTSPCTSTVNDLPSADEPQPWSIKLEQVRLEIPSECELEGSNIVSKPIASTSAPKYTHLLNSIQQMQQRVKRPIPTINIIPPEDIKHEAGDGRSTGQTATYIPNALRSRSASASSGYESATSEAMEHARQAVDFIPAGCRNHPHLVLNPYYRHPFPPGFSYNSGYPGYDYSYNPYASMGMGYYHPMPYYRPPVICADDGLLGRYPGFNQPQFFGPPQKPCTSFENPMPIMQNEMQIMQNQVPQMQNQISVMQSQIPVIIESSGMWDYEYDSATSRGVDRSLLTECTAPANSPVGSAACSPPPSATYSSISSSASSSSPSPVLSPAVPCSSRDPNPRPRPCRRKLLRYFNAPTGEDLTHFEQWNNGQNREGSNRKRSITPSESDSDDEPPIQKRRLEAFELSLQPEILFCERKLTNLSFQHPAAPEKLYYYTTREEANKIFRQMFIGIDERSTARNGSGVYFSELGPENETGVIAYNSNYETQIGAQHNRTEFCFEFKSSELPELRFCIDKRWDFFKVEGRKTTGIWKSAVQRLYLESTQGTYYRRCLNGIGVPRNVMSCTWKL